MRRPVARHPATGRSRMLSSNPIGGLPFRWPLALQQVSCARCCRSVGSPEPNPPVMIEQIGKFDVNYPIWFLADIPANYPLGIRGRTGFLLLPLFTDMELAQRFAEQDHLKN